MARIRTIKPEFPQSESMGRISRDSRLLFVELWTLCDDEGRCRGNSRMLASLLFPYDDDAPGLIDGWLDELDREHCIVRYQVDGATYIQVCNWLNHQKIDKPSVSKIPPFDESSRILANASGWIKDQGPRIKDQGRDSCDEPSARAAVVAALPVQPVTSPIWIAYATAYRERYGIDPVRNAKVNAQLKSLRERLGNDEAAEVAAFYLTHNKPAYVASSHSVDFLLKDCSGLRTEWKTGRMAPRQKSKTAAFMEQIHSSSQVIDGDAERVG